MAIKLINDLGFAIHHYSQQSAFHNATVYPTYFFDNASARQKTSAELWASNSLPISNPRVQAQVRTNVPMGNLWLDNLESRMEGGRAYKVINKNDMTYFDVREDQMLQAILKHGIQAGGKIGGEWVFAMNGTQCKCFLVDGKEYQEALQRAVKSPAVMVKASFKNLQIGQVFSNKLLDEEFVYLGKYDYPSWNYKKNICTKKKEHLFLANRARYCNWYVTTAYTVYQTGRTMKVDDLLTLVVSNMRSLTAYNDDNKMVLEDFIKTHKKA